MEDCIFCKIIKGEIESAKIWEDKEFLAILGNQPNTEGMTLILTKKHYDSYLFDMPEELYLKLMSASKKVAKILEKGLGVKRVAMVMEGMGINHAHVKLYPLHGLKDKFERKFGEEEVFFKEYPGYVTTLEGPKWDIKERRKLAEKITKKVV